MDDRNAKIKTGKPYQNLGVWLPDASECEGRYGIPKLAPATLPDVHDWIPFPNMMSQNDRLHVCGVSMYVYDYQMERLWTNPTVYLPYFQRAMCVLSPDYSMYTDVPTAMSIWSHYRKHWLAAYWQRCGVNVIPTIGWSDESSFDYCFDGEPHGGTVSVSSIGTQRYADQKRLFMLGYDAMLERLEPETVLLFGDIPEGARGNIVQVDAFYKQVAKRRKNKKKGRA